MNIGAYSQTQIGSTQSASNNALPASNNQPTSQTPHKPTAAYEVSLSTEAVNLSRSNTSDTQTTKVQHNDSVNDVNDEKKAALPESYNAVSVLGEQKETNTPTSQTIELAASAVVDPKANAVNSNEVKPNASVSVSNSVDKAALASDDQNSDGNVSLQERTKGQSNALTSRIESAFTDSKLGQQLNLQA